MEPGLKQIQLLDFTQPRPGDSVLVDDTICKSISELNTETLVAVEKAASKLSDALVASGLNDFCLEMRASGEGTTAPSLHDACWGQSHL